MRALVCLVTFFIFGNFAFGSSQPNDSIDNNIVEVSSEAELVMASSKGQRAVNNYGIRCPKDETRSYRSGRYLIYERCSEAGRWVSAGSRRVR